MLHAASLARARRNLRSRANPRRLLQPGESWQLGPVGTPGGVGVANVQPADPECINAKRDYGATRS